MNLTIRRAVRQDVEALTAIYNQAIEAGCTCDTEPYTPKQRLSWFLQHGDDQSPLFTCTLDETPVGYAYLTAYRPGRKAVQHVAEVSYYLDFSVHGRGIGSRLMAFMIEEARRRGITVLLAILLASNRHSIALLEKFGFTEWGRLPGIVRLDGVDIDHLYCGKHLA